MAKANRGMDHTGQFKIPYRYRKQFRGSNKDKWVDKKTYQRFIRWRKENYGC